MMPRKWLARKWGSKNTWVNTLDMDLLQEKVQSAIIKIMAESIGSMMECKTSATLVVMTQLACAAAGKSVDECFNDTQEVELGKTTAFAGMASNFETSGGNAVIDANSVDGETDAKDCTITSIATESLTDTSVEGFETVGRRRLGAASKCKE